MKGKTVAGSAPGTAPYFFAGLGSQEDRPELRQDVNLVTIEPAAAAKPSSRVMPIDGRHDLRTLPLRLSAPNRKPARSSPRRSTIPW